MSCVWKDKLNIVFKICKVVSILVTVVILSTVIIKVIFPLDVSMFIKILSVLLYSIITSNLLANSVLIWLKK